VPSRWCRTLAVVFRFAVLADRALCRAGLTAALALLSSSALEASALASSAGLALDGARR